MKRTTLSITLLCLSSASYADWKSDLSNIGDRLSETAQDAWEITKDFSSEAWDSFISWADDAINTAGEWTDESMRTSKQWLKDAENRLEELMEGDTPEQARQAIDLMADSALIKLFNENPAAKSQFDSSYGYAVFDSRKMSLMLHTNSGSGVAVEKASDKRVYMSMFGLGVSAGIGGKFYQQVVIFHDKRAFEIFTTQGWELSSEASVLAGKEGEEATAKLNSGIAVYQLNAKGLLVDANLSGSKYWVNEELTNSQ